MNAAGLPWNKTMDTKILQLTGPVRNDDPLVFDAHAALQLTELALQRDALPPSTRALLLGRDELLAGFLSGSADLNDAVGRERIKNIVVAALVEDAPEPLDTAPPADPKNPLGSEPLFRGLSAGVLTFDVPSFTDLHGPVYRVQVWGTGPGRIDGTCTCPAFVCGTARGWCKHLFACAKLVPVYPGPHAPAVLLPVPPLTNDEQADFEATLKGSAHGPLCGCQGTPEPPDDTLPVSAPESAPQAVPAPRLSAIHDLLQVAGSKLKYPTLHLLAGEMEITLEPGKRGTAHEGAVWVSGAGDFFNRPRYGRIGPDERFQPGRNYVSGIREALLEFVADPDAAMRDYGRKTGKCGYCLQALTDPASQLLGYGATCQKNWGLSGEMPDGSKPRRGKATKTEPPVVEAAETLIVLNEVPYD